MPRAPWPAPRRPADPGPGAGNPPRGPGSTRPARRAPARVLRLRPHLTITNTGPPRPSPLTRPRPEVRCPYPRLSGVRCHNPPPVGGALLSLLRGEPEDAERGHGDDGRGGAPVVGLGHRFDAAEVADAAAAVYRRVGVEQLPPATGPGQADPVLQVRHCGEVGDAGHHIPRVLVGLGRSGTPGSSGGIASDVPRGAARVLTR